MTSPGDRDDLKTAKEVDARVGRAIRPGDAIWRALWFLGAWFVIAGADVADLPAAAAAVGLATWTSVRLLPPSGFRFSLLGLARLIRLFLYESVVAGVDVARRALDPRLPLRPGLLTYSTSLPPGSARNVFTTLTSLLPGTVPAGEEGSQLIYHCLDIEQAVLSQLAGEEAALSRTFRPSGAGT